MAHGAAHIARWCVYYTGGRRYSSEDGPWDDAPAEGVLVVVEAIGERVTLHMGADHYQLEGDGTIVMRDARTILAHVGVMPMSSIKFGLYVSHTVMERAIEQARREWIHDR